MKNNIKPNFASTIFLLMIVAAVIWLGHRYIFPLAWAALIVIASWPLYDYWRKVICRGRDTLAALTLTLLVALIIFIPLSWILVAITHELVKVSHTVIKLNKTGVAMPHWVTLIPLIHVKVQLFWQHYIAKPDFISQLLSHYKNHFQPIATYAKHIGAKTAYHIVSLLFILLATFFFYRDGESIARLFNRAGHNILAQRWQTYCKQLPAAIRSVINGSVMVGMGIGFIMGISYAIAGVPFPIILGLATAILAIIPFGIALILIIVGLILVAKANYVTAVIIIAWGMLISLAADHIIKPALIGGTTKLPFLLILIGILGGVENLGLIGLFIGPIVMVLLCSLFDELTQ
jgi:predicted PurR-regulated permease PerM